MTYGYSVKENDDRCVEVLDAAVTGMSEVAVPGAFLVDTIPFRESDSLCSYTTGDANYDCHFLTPACPTSKLIRRVNRLLIPALLPPSSSSLVPNSALRPRLVPRNRVESQGRAIQKAA